MTNISIPIFIINLKNDIEKKRYMQDLCFKYGLDVEFINAIDGRLLSNKNISKIYSSKDIIDKFGRKLSLAEIGCALTHKYIYKKIINNKIETALILEDDIIFNQDLLNIITKKSKFNKNWDLILLGHHTSSSRDIDTLGSIWRRQKITNIYKLVRPCENAYGTYAYLITKTGALKILTYLSTINGPIDHYTGNSEYVNLYIVNPAPVKINTYLSDNFNSMDRRIALQKELANTLDEGGQPILKKITRSLGIYNLLSKVRKNISQLLKQVKYLQEYR